VISACLGASIVAAPVLVANALGIFGVTPSNKPERTAAGTAGATARGASAFSGNCMVGFWDRPGSASAVSLAGSPGRRVFAWAAREFPTGRRVSLARGAMIAAPLLATALLTNARVNHPAQTPAGFGDKLRRALMSRFRGILFALAAAAVLVAPLVARAADDTALRLTNAENGSATGYVRVPDSPSWDFTQFTVEAWVQRVGTGYGFTTDIGGSGIVGRAHEGACGSHISAWHLCWLNDGRINFDLVHTYSSSGVYIVTSPIATPLARHHIAASFDGDTVRVYVDGVRVGQAAWTLGALYSGAEDLLIGADNFGCGYFRRFDGFIDDVRMWNVARTDAQIAASMNCRLTGVEKGLVAYWPFDDGSLTDATGNGHSGTAVGTAGAVAYGALAPLSTCTVGLWDPPGSASAVTLDVYPQPANRSTTVSFRLPSESDAALEVFDVTGARVRTLVAGRTGAGAHEQQWDLCDDAGRRVGAGLYFARLAVGGGSRTCRITVVK